MQFERFGKYLLLEKLASGGMAEVYLAKTIGINNFVAIKRILPQFSENSEFIQMFKEEAKIAANLRHSNIVSIHYFGHEKKQLFLVMDFVEGQNLRQILNTLKKENKYLSMDQIVYLIKEVAAGLDYAHRALDNSTGKPLGIIHRDMSPQNIMISFESEVKIVDFGIAKAETQMEQTQAGTIKGKFAYMSPEQAEGQPLDSRTDVFSLGIILWELLSKERLFVAANEAANLKKVRDCQVPSLRKIDASIPIELERIVMKALSKNLDMRYASANSFHKDLNRFLNVQYPEFSKTDFSKFMKGLFHDMFVDNRKKLAEYSQIPVGKDEGLTDGVTKTATSTATITELNTDTEGEQHIPGLDIEERSKKIDLENLKVTSTDLPKFSESPFQSYTRSKIQIGGTQFSHNVHTQTSPFGGVTQSRTQGPASLTQIPSKNSSALLIATSLIVLGGTVWYFLDKPSPTQLTENPARVESPTVTANQPKESVPLSPPNQLPAPVQEPVPTPSASSIPEPISQQASPVASKPEQVINEASLDQSSTSPSSTRELPTIIPINIQSNPSGAIVEIDGRQIGITPYRGSLPTGTTSKIMLRKEGYISFERQELISGENPIRIEAVLQPEPPKGYLVIEMIGAPLDTVIEINGRRIDDKSQLNLYAVPARIPIEIRAYSPFSNASTSTTVSVEVNQKRSVRLVLTRQAQ